jgi:hypothetical protein
MNESTRDEHKGWAPGYNRQGRFDRRLSISLASTVPACLTREFRKEFLTPDLHEAHGWDMGNKVMRGIVK